LLTLAALFFAPQARAFHAAATFDVEPGGGGGGHIYYTGSPRSHGWKCTLCHTDPPGKISLHIGQKEIFKSFSYTPGQLYQFDVDLIGEHAGLTASLSNYNSLMVEILDQNQAAVGTLFYVEEDFSQIGDAAIASANNNNTAVGTTKWTFKWKAPAATDGPDGGAPGKVTFYFSAIDGDGAKSGATQTLTDPFHDDFFFVQFDVEQGPAAATGENAAPPAPVHAPPPKKLAEMAPPPAKREAGPLAPVLASSALGLGMLGLARRKKRR
jgi:hypothetical protein